MNMQKYVARLDVFVVVVFDVVFVRCVHNIICYVTATTLVAQVRYGPLVGRCANYLRACEKGI